MKNSSRPAGAHAGWKPLPFEIGYVAPVVGKGWTNREPASVRRPEPRTATEYATHRPSGEKVAAGGDNDRVPATSVTFLSGRDKSRGATSAQCEAMTSDVPG